MNTFLKLAGRLASPVTLVGKTPLHRFHASADGGYPEIWTDLEHGCELGGDAFRVTAQYVGQSGTDSDLSPGPVDPGVPFCPCAIGGLDGTQHRARIAG